MDYLGDRIYSSREEAAAAAKDMRTKSAPTPQPATEQRDDRPEAKCVEDRPSGKPMQKEGSTYCRSGSTPRRQFVCSALLNHLGRWD